MEAAKKAPRVGINRSNLCLSQFKLFWLKTGRAFQVRHPQRNTRTSLLLMGLSSDAWQLKVWLRPICTTDTLFSCGSNETAQSNADGDKDLMRSAEMFDNVNVM